MSYIVLSTARRSRRLPLNQISPVIVSITKLSIMIGSPIKWVSNYRYPITLENHVIRTSIRTSIARLNGLFLIFFTQLIESATDFFSLKKMMSKGFFFNFEICYRYD